MNNINLALAIGKNALHFSGPFFIRGEPLKGVTTFIGKTIFDGAAEAVGISYTNHSLAMRMIHHWFLYEARSMTENGLPTNLYHHLACISVSGLLAGAKYWTANYSSPHSTWAALPNEIEETIRVPLTKKLLGRPLNSHDNIATGVWRGANIHGFYVAWKAGQYVYDHCTGNTTTTECLLEIKEEVISQVTNNPLKFCCDAACALYALKCMTLYYSPYAINMIMAHPVSASVAVVGLAVTTGIVYYQSIDTRVERQNLLGKDSEFDNDEF